MFELWGDVLERVILHSDLNSFYASVECFHNPDIRNKPVAVCGSVEERHGIVLAANQIAKKFQIKTGDAVWQAKLKCPNIIIVAPHYDHYLRFSKAVREIYTAYSPCVESFGLDECWIDVSGTGHNLRQSVLLADEIRERIQFETGITASIGVSDNKIFAKLGSDLKKPNATTCIKDKTEIYDLPVSDLLYVGRATTTKLNNMGIFKIGHLAEFDVKSLESRLGKWGRYIWQFANGYDRSPVSEAGKIPVIKSIGNSTTTPRDLKNVDEIKITVMLLAESVAARLREQHCKCKNVQISIRYNDLSGYQRQGKLTIPSCTAVTIGKKALQLVLKNMNEKPIRSLGVKARQLTFDEYPQLSFLPEYQEEQEQEEIEYVIDHIRKRYGHFSIQLCHMLSDLQLSQLSPKEEHVIFPVSYFR